MTKKLASFFIAALAAGILFIACPIEYVPTIIQPPPPPEGMFPGWQNNVNVPSDFSESVSGQAPGYLAAQGMPAFVEVTIHFDAGAFDGVSIQTPDESLYMPAVYDAINNWRERVAAGGIQAIPDILPVDNHPEWPSAEYVDAFTGGTVSVNALTIAAFRALEDFVELED